ncbi:zf-CCHC domain-containing protein [Tanacetum coccineum]
MKITFDYEIVTNRKNHSKHPVGIAENMLVEVGKFIFLVDFVILKMEEDSKVPLILGRPFLHTADSVIQVKQKQLNLRVGTERMNFHIDYAMKHSYSNDDTCFSIDVINEILEEYFDALLDEGSKILYSIEGTILEEKLFAEFDGFMTMTTEENSESEFDTEEPPFKKITFNTNCKIKTSLEEPHTDLELLVPKIKRLHWSSWSDSENDAEDKTNDETCLMAQSSNEVTLNSSHYSDDASSLDNDSMQIEYDSLCEISLKIINKNKILKTKRDLLEKEILELNEKIKKLERSKEVEIVCKSCEELKSENAKLKETQVKFVKFDKSANSLREMLNNQKSPSCKIGLGFDSDKASTSGTKTMSFVGSSAEKGTDGSTIKVHGSTLPGSVCLRTCLEPDEWIKDSGCSKHMTCNKSLFSTYKAYDEGNVVFGSNLKGKIIGKGSSIVAIRTDHGLEFDNEVQFEAYCDTQGMTHNFSAPHTPQSNVVVENKE